MTAVPVMTIPLMREKLYPDELDREHIRLVNWRAGKRMQRYFTAQVSALPRKELHEKTDPMAGGTHGIAQYTEEHWPKMEALIHEADVVIRERLFNSRVIEDDDWDWVW
jgi:hypothetical protein